MQSRTRRHRRILDLIGKEPLGTQEELRAALLKAGIEVNQATLSRDIRELGLVKIASKGAYRYVGGEATPRSGFEQNGTALASVRAFIGEIDHAGNIVVVKTDDGAAAHVASAIDALSLPDVLGSVAGDNTLILIVKNGCRPAQVVKKLKTMTQ